VGEWIARGEGREERGGEGEGICAIGFRGMYAAEFHHHH